MRASSLGRYTFSEDNVLVKAIRQLASLVSLNPGVVIDYLSSVSDDILHVLCSSEITYIDPQYPRHRGNGGTKCLGIGD
jgi:hypothetical protein